MTIDRDLTPGEWREYDFCAAWCARRGLRGKLGDPLPDLLSPAVYDEINANPEEFEERVAATAYAFAMARHEEAEP